MKTITFNIVKINRVWIEATIGSTCPCKIKISENTASLKEGDEVELLVEDVSVRSKYGTDLRYDAKPQSKEKIFLQAAYNADLVEKCKKLGGVWDSEGKVWVFDAIVKNEVEALEEIYCSEMINIEISVKDSEDYVHANQAPVRFMGYTLCTATGRDSGAKLADGVALIRGKIDSSGSMKNWITKISSGSVLRLSVPKNILDNCKYEEKEWNITIL